MRWACSLIVFVFAGCALWAQSPEDLVRRAAEYYQSLDSYQIRGKLQADIPGTTWTFFADAYAEDAGPRVLPDNKPGPFVALQKITNFRMVNNAVSSAGAPPHAPDKVPFWWARLTQIAHSMKAAKSGGLQTVMVQNEGVSCQVVDVDYEETSRRGTPVRWSTRLWISPSKKLVVQLAFTAGAPPLRWLFTLQSLTTNQPPSREFLERADEPGGGSRSEWVGKRAPGFVLSDGAGNRIELSKLLPRVVLLDFWGPYCGPCRAELLMLQGMASQYRDKGLEVWPITDDTPDSAQRWMSRFGVNQPSLFDPDRTAFDLYEVNAIPVVVLIGRDGKIAAYFEGLQPMSDLRTAVESALSRAPE